MKTVVFTISSFVRNNMMKQCKFLIRMASLCYVTHIPMAVKDEATAWELDRAF